MAQTTLVSGYNFGPTNTGTAAFPYTANHGSGTLTTNFPTVSIFTGTTVNAVSGDTAGGAFAPAGIANNGDEFTFSLNLTGFNAPVLTYAAQRTASGFSNEQFLYSTNGGTSFTAFTNVTGIPTAFALQTVDFSGVTALANDASAEIEIIFTGATTATGNNRLDNFQFNSTTFSGGGGGGGATSLYFDTNGSTAGIGINGGNSPVFDTTTANFTPTAAGTGTAQAYDNTKLAVFGGTAGAVTVGTVTATAGLQFVTGGYTFNGGTLTLTTAPTIEVTNAGDTATINTQISGTAVSGTAGLTKQGLGTLVLGSTANNFTGTVFIKGGTLSIGSDANLGAADTITLSNNANLQVTQSVSLASSRSLAGTGGLNVGAGNTLTVNGAVNMGTISLVNTGTVVFAADGSALSGLTFSAAGTADLQGVSSGVGSLTFSAAGTLESTTGQTIGATALDATSLNGTATVNAGLSFGAAGTVNVGATGNLVLGGAISSTGTSALKKTGTGTLVLNGSNGGLYRVQIGTASATAPTQGGTVSINNASAVGANQLYLNVGTLNATTDLTSTTGNAIPVGASIGGLTNGVAVITGSNVEFAGASDIFESTIANALTVNNTTILSGAVTTSSKTAQTAASPGLLLNGTGTLRLTGANTFTDPVAISGGVTLEAAGTGGNQSLGATTKITANAGGTLLLSTPNQVNTTAPLVLNTGAISLANGANHGSGATLSGGAVTNASAVGLGALTLAGNSTLNYLGTAATAVFTSFDPTNAGTGTFALNVTGGSFGTATDSADGVNNRLIFNQDISAAGYLGDITFNGIADATETALDNGFFEITPAAVPEPATVGGGLLVAGILIWHQRSRRRGLV